jgi:hypothetical protein
VVVPLDCVGFVEKVYFAYHALTLCLSLTVLVATPCVFERRLAAVSLMFVVELQTAMTIRWNLPAACEGAFPISHTGAGCLSGVATRSKIHGPLT